MIPSYPGEFYQVKCRHCGGIKTTCARKETRCPYCGRRIYVNKSEVSK